ncbi:hypothetical protein [Bacillus pumilus]|uniref:hypothetical protein n=1 Tax=Bacillus pumilus TaxID=1408 RepID=UPI003D06F7E5
MMEGSITAIFKMYLFLLCILAILSVAIFFIQVNQINEYKQIVNYQIERNGGLTPEAISKLKDYDQKHFSGRFSIESPMLNQKVKYGDEVDYTVHSTFEILYFEIPNVKIPIKGSALSLTR